MAYIITLYAIAQFTAALISMSLIAILWKRRYSRGGLYLFFFFIAVFEWTVANTLEASAVSQHLKIFWSKVSYIGVQTAPVFLLLYAIEYTGKSSKVTEFKKGILFFVPILTIVLAVTNESHGLIWSGFTPGPEESNSLIYHHGMFFWVAISYIYLLAFGTSFLLFFFTVHSQRMYQQQNKMVMLAAIFPWVGSVLYLFDLNPFPGLDLTSISFLFTGLMLLWAILKENLLDVIPISHEFLIENIEDGILVIDESFRLIEINSAAEGLLEIKRGEVIGKLAKEKISFWDSISEYFNLEESRKFEIELEESTLEFLEIHISPLSNSQKRFLGWVLVLENISRRKKYEIELQSANNRLEKQLLEIQSLQNKLHEQAVRDALTGTFNRGYLDDMLVREIAGADRKGYALSVFMIDVDVFKSINDSHGHKAGDMVIIAIGKMLVNETRACDCVCRYGGDEFIVVMPEMKKEDAEIRAEKWREMLRLTRFKFHGEVIRSTISIGIAEYPGAGMDANALIDAADNALYKAKEAGRDCVRSY